MSDQCLFVLGGPPAGREGQGGLVPAQRPLRSAVGQDPCGNSTGVRPCPVSGPILLGLIPDGPSWPEKRGCFGSVGMRASPENRGTGNGVSAPAPGGPSPEPASGPSQNTTVHCPALHPILGPSWAWVLGDLAAVHNQAWSQPLRGPKVSPWGTLCGGHVLSLTNSGPSRPGSSVSVTVPL